MSFIPSIDNSTSTLPLACTEGTTQETIDEEIYFMAEASTSLDPNRHLISFVASIPKPETVTMAPPARRPLLGQIRTILMGLTYSYVKDPTQANPPLTNLKSTLDAPANVGTLHKPCEDDKKLEGFLINPK